MDHQLRNIALHEKHVKSNCDIAELFFSLTHAKRQENEHVTTHLLFPDNKIIIY